MAAPISPSYSCGNFCTMSGDYWYVWMELGFNKWLVYTHVGPLQEILTKKNKNIRSENFKIYLHYQVTILKISLGLQLDWTLSLYT